MQVGAEVVSYQRNTKIKKEKKCEKSEYPLKFIAYLIGAIFISRVTMINNTAPFGIALVLAMIDYNDSRVIKMVSVGSIIGYFTLFKTVENIPLNLVAISSITLMNLFFSNAKKNKLLIMSGLLLLVEIIAYKYFINKYTLGISFLTSMFDIGCILPIYFIIDYAIKCSGDIKTKHLFSNEEIISMAIVISLVISGTRDIGIYGITLRNVLALSFIMMVSYVNGCAVGAATGVAMGLVVGISSNNMMNFISVYGVCGLMAGVFKDTGKWFTALVYLIIFAILKLYSGISGDIKVIEGIVNCVIFLIIPEAIYDKMIIELNWEKKQQMIGSDYIDKIKEIFSSKLFSLSSVLQSMSSTLSDLVDNDRLVIKQKSSGLIDNLAEKVCGNCDMQSICWKREFHQTYVAFGELIQNYQDNNNKIPFQLESNCVRRTYLSNATEEIVNNYIISEMWRKRVSEGRQLLSQQLNNMSITVDDIVNDFNKEVNFNIELENNIRKALNKNSIEAYDILCYEDKNERNHVKLSTTVCGKKNKCIKEILPLISEVCGKTMCVCGDGCVIDSKTKKCVVDFQETPKYHIACYSARECKEGEKINGDSYSYCKLNDGTFMTIISDGMGSGPQAARESKAAVELLERFMISGFSNETAINTVNSIMSFKFIEDEKFSTIDLNNIDLYTGEVTFMKVGAVPSFIKSGRNVEEISSKTLPIGVLDKVDVEVIERSITTGDIIVTVSDGILDAYKKDWIGEFLKNNQCNNPKELAFEILNTAKELSGGKAKDDMTVIVSKVYNLY